MYHTFTEADCITERVRPDHAQTCGGGEGQAAGDEEEACVQHEEVEQLFLRRACAIKQFRIPLALVDVFSIRQAGAGT